VLRIRVRGEKLSPDPKPILIMVIAPKSVSYKIPPFKKCILHRGLEILIYLKHNPAEH
jgi:hypothetical protein